ncbi:MAG: glycosyltransferase family 39 protein [Bacteroidetes bacterium]|nr:glycosyltransferase family 39 protein [Bacteroidota bacterium]
MKTFVNPIHYALIIVIASVLFFPFLGSVHLFDWDEINFAESAREMMLTGNYNQVQINFQGFWEKPPLFIWMQVLSMKVFGVNEFAARFPNAIFGILTLLLIYKVGRQNFKGHLAHWWVLSYLGAITPQFYFRTGLIDPVFNFFIFLSILQFYKVIKNSDTAYNANVHFLMAGIYTGIAILCKGPVALLIGLLVMFSMVFAKRLVWFFNFGNLLIYLITTGIVASIWFLPETIQNGPYFILQFIEYQIGLFSQNVAGHEQPFYYHTLVLLFGCFPISIIAIAGWKKNELYAYHENLFRTTMQCLFWVVLILFSIVRTKIVHYSSLCWLPLTFMSAYAIESFNHRQFKFKWYFKVALIVVGLLLSIAFISFPLIMAYNKVWLVNLIQDDFTKMNLMADVNWSFSDAIPGLGLLILLIVYIYQLFQDKPVLTFGTFLMGTTLVIWMLSVSFTGKIEQHTQGTAINFFKSIAKENCYIFNVGYKSYAPYFYGKTQPLKYMDGLNLLNRQYFKKKNKTSYLQLNEEEKAELDDVQKHWLIGGRVDRSVYFIAKSNDREDLPEFKNLKVLWDKNGFVVYKRMD